LQIITAFLNPETCYLLAPLKKLLRASKADYTIYITGLARNIGACFASLATPVPAGTGH